MLALSLNVQRSGSTRVSGSGPGMSEDKQDPLLWSSVLVWLGDTGAEAAEERDRRQRIRLRRGSLEHELAEFAADAGTFAGSLE